MENYKRLILIPMILFSGCFRYLPQESSPNSYYLNPSKDITQIGRVTILELANNSSIHQISEIFTDSLFQEIQKKQVFGLTKIEEDNPLWRSLQLNVDTSYTFEELLQMQKTLKSDAILTGIITGFEPYPHMTIGVRLKLIDLSDGHLIWALEQVWDTTDKRTQDRIEAYYNPKRILFSDENLSGQLGSVSQLKFFKFVSHEITETLQENR